MKPFSVMLIAGEASGDLLAAELVEALRPALRTLVGEASDDVQPLKTTLAPRFFGAGGPRMAAAGVELLLDFTAHTAFGVFEVFRRIADFRRIFLDLLEAAARRQPELIILVDYAGFNRRFAAAVKRRVRARAGLFRNWQPKIVYFVSPQVWASREGRADQLAEDVDLLLSIFPFEKAWYAQRVPRFRVEFVGHPVIDRHAGRARATAGGAEPRVVLLPGSRDQELRHHLPVMVAVVRQMLQTRPLRLLLVLANESLRPAAERWARELPGLVLQVGGLTDALAGADLAIASSGTVTVECAYFRVPTVVIYRVFPPTFWIARMLVRVPFVAMPNLLVGEAVYPELLQGAANRANIVREAMDLLENQVRRKRVQDLLARAVASLGPPGACRRAAEAIVRLFQTG